MNNTNPMQFLMQMMSGGNNPQQIVQNLMAQNPQFKTIMTQAQNSGLSMEQYTRNYAAQNNINIQPMLDMMSKRGFRP